MQHRWRGDRHLRRDMRDLGMFLQEFEMIEHRMVGGKIELADDAHRVMPRLDASELNAGVGVKQFATRQLRKKVKMPPGAAEFAVGREPQADRGLLVHDLFDLEILDLAQILRRYLALLQSGARSEEHTSELQSQFHLVCRLL